VLDVIGRSPDQRRRAEAGGTLGLGHGEPTGGRGGAGGRGEAAEESDDLIYASNDSRELLSLSGGNNSVY
jgi:hypothetical protein